MSRNHPHFVIDMKNSYRIFEKGERVNLDCGCSVSQTIDSFQPFGLVSNLCSYFYMDYRGKSEICPAKSPIAKLPCTRPKGHSNEHIAESNDRWFDD